MKVTVKLWGQLKHLSENEKLNVEAESLSDVFFQIAKDFPQLELALITDGKPNISILIFINDEQVSIDNPPALNDGDRITLMSPISGG